MSENEFLKCAIEIAKRLSNKIQKMQENLDWYELQRYIVRKLVHIIEETFERVDKENLEDIIVKRVDTIYYIIVETVYCTPFQLLLIFSFPNVIVYTSDRPVFEYKLIGPFNIYDEDILEKLAIAVFDW